MVSTHNADSSIPTRSSPKVALKQSHAQSGHSSLACSSIDGTSSGGVRVRSQLRSAAVIGNPTSMKDLPDSTWSASRRVRGDGMTPTLRSLQSSRPLQRVTPSTSSFSSSRGAGPSLRLRIYLLSIPSSGAPVLSCSSRIEIPAPAIESLEDTARSRRAATRARPAARPRP
eukprot:scaffold92416_cov35-Tisochrysis_lutea.AAC.1